MAKFGPKQILSQKLLQKLSPQQIQLMKLLQIPTASLEQRIQEELEANPALESGDESDELLAGLSESDLYDNDADYYAREQKAEGNATDSDDDYQSNNDNDSSDLNDAPLADTDRETTYDESYEEENSAYDDGVELDDYMREIIDDDPSIYRSNGEGSGDDDDKVIPIEAENTYHEYLEQQLGLLDLADEREQSIALQIIGSIDDDGYLRRDPRAMVDDLLFSQNISTDEAEIDRLLKKIQQFDPPGTGARDLRECLLLQLRRKLDRDDSAVTFEERLNINIALKIIGKYFDEFTKKHYDRLCKQLDIDEDELKDAIGEILHLNPKPASGFASKATRSLNYIVPDFIVTNRDGELELSLNARNAPDLRISEQYREMLKSFNDGRAGRRASKTEKEAILFIKQKIDSARWFIDAIKQRQQTMMLTMGAILHHQEQYFLTGDERKLRPMILKDIAETTGLDISTVSRVANSKYVQTEYGAKLLKEFFSESMQNQEGEEISTLEVKKILSELIGAEHKRRPLSDERLMELLTERGYNIARRTVAKYREQLNIPVARLRKEL